MAPRSLMQQQCLMNRRVFDEQALVERRPGAFTLVSGTRLYHWRIAMKGPPKTPYEGGLFLVVLDIPLTYPYDPPKVCFWNRIYHPNINFDGEVYMGHIPWTSDWTIPNVLKSLYHLLSKPIPNVCLNELAAKLYNHRRYAFNQIARDWTKSYRWNGETPDLMMRSKMWQ